MKTKKFSKASLCVIMLLALSAITASAKSWRINNDTRKQANFTDINAAMASADVADGDTLYLDPGCLLSSKQTITKAVTVIGTGYFLKNEMVASTINAEVSINASGVRMNGVSVNGEVKIAADNISIERCCVKNSIRGYGATRYGLTVLQCYVNSSSGYSCIGDNFSNSTIKNNIIRHLYKANDDYCGIYNVHNSEISNNYIAVISCTKSYICNVLDNITNSQIYNNIIKHGIDNNRIFSNTASDYNNSFYNNVVTAAEGTYSNVSNIVWLGSADMSTVFAEGTDDAAYHLNEGSPAKGAAADGGDCGPYGGANPYVEGGKPLFHPFINDVTVSVKPVNGKIKLKLNAKMQNE